MWTRWDARHFLEIAEFGYTDPRTDPHATAFFPLWPLLIRAFSATGLSPALAAMLLSAAASVVAVAYLYRLAEGELQNGGAGSARPQNDGKTGATKDDGHDYHVIVLADDAEDLSQIDAAEARRRLEEAQSEAAEASDERAEARMRIEMARVELAESGRGSQN